MLRVHDIILTKKASGHSLLPHSGLGCAALNPGCSLRATEERHSQPRLQCGGRRACMMLPSLYMYLYLPHISTSLISR